jgi:cytochrome c-type biogenesis protein CcmE
MRRAGAAIPRAWLALGALLRGAHFVAANVLAHAQRQYHPGER